MSEKVSVDHFRVAPGKALLLLVVLLLSGAAFLGCQTTGTIPKGWSGAGVADNTLFIGSMEGKLVAVSTLDGRRLWTVPLEGAESGGGGFGCAAAPRTVAIYGTPAVGKDLVYVGGYNGIIYAFNRDAARDEPRWVYPRQGSIGAPVVGGIAVGQGRVYFGSSDGKVYALNAADGFKEWEFETGDKIWATPALYGDTLLIGSFDKKLYALNATNGSKKWEFETEGAVVSSPVTHDGTVYIGSFDKYLYAVNINDGSLRWKFMAGNWFWAKPVIADGAIYAGCLDGKVYVLDVRNGDKLAEFDLGGPVSSTPVLANDSVVVATEKGMVYALDAGNNRPRELAGLGAKVYAALSTDGKTVFVHTAKDELHAVNARSGSELWRPLSLPTPSPQSSPSGTTNWGPVLALMAVGMIIVLAISALRRRRQA